MATKNARKHRRLDSGKNFLRPVGDTVATGISGLDRIMSGGYTRAQATILRGASGTGKTLFSLMFAANNPDAKATVYASFDEPVSHLEAYVRGWDKEDRVVFLDFTPDAGTMVSGANELDLGGLIVRLEHAIKKSGSKTVVLDAFDTLFATYQNAARIRQELYKVFSWCRQQNLTLIATVGTKNSYEPSTDVIDYTCDCTILLRQNMHDGLMTRVLRVLKLRGRAHGTNEYPFLIDEQGISVLPVTDASMSERTLRRRLSTGIEELDKMLGGRGFWQGSTVMLSGQSGAGKSLFSATLAQEMCNAGKKVIYVTFEESESHFLRDIQSAGIKLNPHVNSGRCHIVSRRVVEQGLEEHIILLLRSIDSLRPDVVIIDPISALLDLTTYRTFKNLVLRLCHGIKVRGVTVVLTELLRDDSGDKSDINISSIVDTWIRLSRTESDGVMRRFVRIHKSRGAATSNESREFEINRHGIEISGRRNRGSKS